MNWDEREASDRFYGKLACALCVGGAVVGAILWMFGKALTYDMRIWSFLFFDTAQVTAIVVGCHARREYLGKVSAITAGILLIISFAV